MDIRQKVLVEKVEQVEMEAVELALQLGGTGRLAVVAVVAQQQ
jgi:hypothetical protein